MSKNKTPHNSSESWDVKSNSPPPKSAQSQSIVSRPGREGHVGNKSLVTDETCGHPPVLRGLLLLSLHFRPPRPLKRRNLPRADTDMVRLLALTPNNHYEGSWVSCPRRDFHPLDCQL